MPDEGDLAKYGRASVRSGSSSAHTTGRASPHASVRARARCSRRQSERSPRGARPESGSPPDRASFWLARPARGPRRARRVRLRRRTGSGGAVRRERRQAGAPPGRGPGTRRAQRERRQQGHEEHEESDEQKEDDGKKGTKGNVESTRCRSRSRPRAGSSRLGTMPPLRSRASTGTAAPPQREHPQARAHTKGQSLDSGGSEPGRHRIGVVPSRPVERERGGTCRRHQSHRRRCEPRYSRG